MKEILSSKKDFCFQGTNQSWAISEWRAREAKGQLEFLRREDKWRRKKLNEAKVKAFVLLWTLAKGLLCV